MCKFLCILHLPVYVSHAFVGFVGFLVGLVVVGAAKDKSFKHQFLQNTISPITIKENPLTYVPFFSDTTEPIETYDIPILSRILWRLT